MKNSKTKFFYIAIAFASLLVCGCSDDWIWEPGPGPSHNVSGSVGVVDSLGIPIPGAQSDIPVSLIKYGYSKIILDSTTTDKNGNWSFSNEASGNDELVVEEPGYSASLTRVQIPFPQYAMPIGLTIGVAMKHAVVVDSFFIDTSATDTTLIAYGHDPVGIAGNQMNILVCLDTTPNVPSSGQHLSTSFSVLFNDGPHPIGGYFNEDVLFFSGSSLRNSKADTLYLVAYAINPIEANKQVDIYPPQDSGYRTCGPPSNIIAIPRK